MNQEEEETLDQNEQNEDTVASDSVADDNNEPEEEKDPLEKALAEIEQLKTQMLYKTAEFDNYRKRTLKEKAELILNGGEKAVSAILSSTCGKFSSISSSCFHTYLPLPSTEVYNAPSV